MTRIIDTPKALLVEVPEGATEVRMVGNELNGYYFEVYNKEGFSIATIQFPAQYSYGQLVLAAEMTSDKIVEVFDYYQSEPPYQPYYRPYGMSEEEYIHEVRIAEHKLSKWEAENHPDNQFFELLRSHNLKPETTVVIPKL